MDEIIKKMKDPKGSKSTPGLDNSATCEFCRSNIAIYECHVHDKKTGQACCNKPGCIDEFKRYKLRKYPHLLDEELVKAGIPKKYRNMRPDQDITDLITDSRGLFLYGPTGTGKTSLACILAREWIADLQQVEFVSVPELIMRLQVSFRRDNCEDAYSIIKRYCQVDILILDDLGAEKVTDFVRQSIYFLLNTREQSDKKTIITSNYTPADIADRFDERTASRIVGLCQVKEIGGKDRRVLRAVHEAEKIIRDSK